MLRAHAQTRQLQLTRCARSGSSCLETNKQEDENRNSPQRTTRHRGASQPRPTPAEFSLEPIQQRAGRGSAARDRRQWPQGRSRQALPDPGSTQARRVRDYQREQRRRPRSDRSRCGTNGSHDCPRIGSFAHLGGRRLSLPMPRRLNRHMVSNISNFGIPQPALHLG